MLSPLGKSFHCENLKGRSKITIWRNIGQKRENNKKIGENLLVLRIGRPMLHIGWALRTWELLLVLNNTSVAYWVGVVHLLNVPKTTAKSPELPQNTSNHFKLLGSLLVQVSALFLLCCKVFFTLIFHQWKSNPHFTIHHSCSLWLHCSPTYFIHFCYYCPNSHILNFTPI